MSIIGKKFEKHNGQILEHKRLRPNSNSVNQLKCMYTVKKVTALYMMSVLTEQVNYSAIYLHR